MWSSERQWCHLQMWLSYLCLPQSYHEEGFRWRIEKCLACVGSSEHSMHMFIPHPGSDSTWLKCRKGDPQCAGRWRSPEPGILQRDAFTPLPASQPACLPTLDSQRQQTCAPGSEFSDWEQNTKKIFPSRPTSEESTSPKKQILKLVFYPNVWDITGSW